MHCRTLYGFIALLCVPANTASAAAEQSERFIDLVKMRSETVDAPAAAAPVSLSSTSSGSKPFRVYNLSRRDVSFEMNQTPSAMGQDGESSLPAAAQAYRVANRSSISIPVWMSGGYFASPSASEPCSPMAYQSSGFLGPQAEARRATFYDAMAAIACEHGISPGLFDAMIIQESRYNPTSVSPKKAFGLAQLMPGTAQQLGVNSHDPVENLRGGARYLRQQLDRFGKVHLALAAYNAGPGRIRGGVVPQIIETQIYVTTILENWSRLARPANGFAPQFPRPSQSVRSVSLSAF